ncbi:MAG: hypothetical protein K8J31_10530, partial [Anaerolineae bacterium]|nr:hypothetical protein [Anaerolineae bacterium]
MSRQLPGAQHLNVLWRAVNAAAELRELTRTRRTYVFNTSSPITFYLRAEKADVHIARWHLPKVEVTYRLEGSFGWRATAEQDDAGVYVVAHRRWVLGELSSASFAVVVPHDAFLVLKLVDGRVIFEHVEGTLQV